MSAAPLATSTLGRIAVLAKEQASGELICASDSVEVHVYLQRGRVAWATDAAQPLAFTRYLLERAQIDVEVFREILDSCRREKRPIGETLIAWGVATKEEVRDALRHQIELALALLHQCGHVQTLFLKRTSQFADYDAELTFALEELLVKTGPQMPMTRSRLMAAIAVDGPAAPPLLRLRAQLDGIEWAEVLEGTTSLEWFPEASQKPRSASDLAKNTLLDGSELVAMRNGSSTLAGVALSPTRSLWCLVDDKHTVGELISALSSFQTEHVFPPTEPTTNAGRLWSFGPSLPVVDTAMRELLERVPELSGLFITDPATPKSTYGVGRMTVSSQDLITLIERRAHAFVQRSATAEASEVDGEGMTARRAMTAESQFLLYAAEIVIGDRPRFVWLTLDRSSSKGIGWGYLTTLSRTMIRALKAG